jgi:hypothetical protein
LEDLELLFSEDRFSKLRPYGIILTKNENELIVLKINKTFSFRIGKDGCPQWEKRKSNQTVEPTRYRAWHMADVQQTNEPVPKAFRCGSGWIGPYGIRSNLFPCISLGDHRPSWNQDGG